MEDLAYRRMIDWCYLNESSLPLDLDEIAKRICMRTHNDCIAFVLQEFFIHTKKGYEQKRITDELKKYKSKSESAKKSAKARWSATDPEPQAIKGDANAMRTHNERNAKHKTLNTKHKTLNNTKEAALSVFTDYGFSDEQIKLIFETRTRNSKTAKASKITKIIANSICKEMKSCIDLGYSVDAVLNEWHETAWVSFKADWIQKRIPLNNQLGNYNERNQFRGNTKETPLERMERKQKAMDVRREASSNNDEILGSDESVIYTQVSISGG